MANALTTTQIEILRRLRDGIDLVGEPWLSGLVGDVSFLRHLGLVDLQGIFNVSLSENGHLYLSAAELESRESHASGLAGPLQEQPRDTEGPDDAIRPH